MDTERKKAIDEWLDSHCQTCANNDDRGTGYVNCQAECEVQRDVGIACIHYEEYIQKIQELEQAQIEKAFQLGRESAELKIVRCKDCKHHHYEKNIPYCDRIDYGYGVKDNDFCSHAERRWRASDDEN